MAAVSIPQDGLVLLHTSNAEEPSPTLHPPAQVMRLNLAQQATDEILKSLRGSDQVKIRFGKRITLHYGSQSQQVYANPESYPSEWFLGSTNDKGPFYFSGRSSHSLEVQKAQEATAQSDEALATLENTLKSVQEQRASNEARLVTDRDELRHLAGDKKNPKARVPSPLFPKHGSAIRKDLFLNGITRSTPASPFLGAAHSPGLGPTSAPLGSSGPLTKAKIRLDAIRIPLIHLLASRPQTPKVIAEKLRARKEDCDRLLDKVAKDCSKSMGKKELKEKSYKELDVWKFPYPSQEDRQAAIDRAIHAFDRMRVARSDNLWQSLLPEERRGKGECLSKLNLDPTGALTPKPSAPRPTKPSADSNAGTNAIADRGRLATVKAEVLSARAQSSDPLPKKKVSEKEAISKHQARKGAVDQLKNKRGRDGSNSERKSAKGQGKFKSSEIIEDSDDEMEAAKATVLQPAPQQKKKRPSDPASDVAAKRLKPPPSPQPKKSADRSRPSSSANVATKTLAKQADEHAYVSHKQLPRPRAESSALSKKSPRPRTGSSPQKPSPLASSPTNATDMDNSNSSKPSSLSSATSSPPSSSDTRKFRPQSRPLPAIVHEASKKSPVKRRAPAASEDVPEPKRQQISNKSHKPLTNGITIHHEERPHVARKMSESENESVSSPEKPDEARLALNEKSRTFKTYYRSYKEMHARVMNAPQKDDAEVKRLNDMHKRIAGLKQEIWDDWKLLAKRKL